MMKKERFMGAALFSLFMFIGWLTGLSPLKTSLNTTKEISASIKRIVADGPDPAAK